MNVNYVIHGLKYIKMQTETVHVMHLKHTNEILCNFAQCIFVAENQTFDMKN